MMNRLTCCETCKAPCDPSLLHSPKYVGWARIILAVNSDKGPISQDYILCPRCSTKPTSVKALLASRPGVPCGYSHPSDPNDEYDAITPYHLHVEPIKHDLNFSNFLKDPRPKKLDLSKYDLLVQPDKGTTPAQTIEMLRQIAKDHNVAVVTAQQNPEQYLGNHDQRHMTLGKLMTAEEIRKKLHKIKHERPDPDTIVVDVGFEHRHDGYDFSILDKFGIPEPTNREKLIEVGKRMLEVGEPGHAVPKGGLRVKTAHAVNFDTESIKHLDVIASIKQKLHACQRCGGNGKRKTCESQLDDTCPACNGSGRVMTDADFQAFRPEQRVRVLWKGPGCEEGRVQTGTIVALVHGEARMAYRVKIDGQDADGEYHLLYEDDIVATIEPKRHRYAVGQRVLALLPTVNILINNDVYMKEVRAVITDLSDEPGTFPAYKLRIDGQPGVVLGYEDNLQPITCRFCDDPHCGEGCRT